MLAGRIEPHGSSMASRSRRPSITVVVATVALIGGSPMLAACISEPPEVSVDDPQLVEGRAIYAASCSSCHGSDGGGGLGTKLADGAVVEAFPDIEEQIALVLDGRNQMPAFAGRLSEEQVRAVSRYTREVL